MSASPTTIRTAKRRALQTELGIALGLWALLMYAWNQTPFLLKLAIAAALYGVAWEITRHWVIALILLSLWVGYRGARSRHLRRAYGSVRNYKFFKALEECPFCGKVHSLEDWCSDD